jgi:uncharacterized lipoprotein YajG
MIGFHKTLKVSLVVVFAVALLAGSSQSLQAVNYCPPKITACNQCTQCIAYRITPQDIRNAQRCIKVTPREISTLPCPKYDVTGDGRVTLTDYQVLTQCQICQQQLSPTQ